MQTKPPHCRCLILACGNTLRGDDGVGPWLSAWAEERFDAEPAVRVLSRQQWTPDLSEDVALSEYVLFIDCAVDSGPGEVRLREIDPAPSGPPLATHHVSAADLLILGQELYDSKPRAALQLTVGAASVEIGETLTLSVMQALPEACDLLEATVRGWLASFDSTPGRH